MTTMNLSNSILKFHYGRIHDFNILILYFTILLSKYQEYWEPLRARGRRAAAQYTHRLISI